MATNASMPLSTTVTQAGSGFTWSTPIKIGLIGGVVAVYLCLVGIITASANRQVITGILTMAQVMLLAVFIGTGYTAAQRSASGRTPQPSSRLVIHPSSLFDILAGAIAGLIVGLMLAVLVILGQTTNLSSIFVRATDQLWQILTLNRGVPAGLLLMVAIATVVGALSAGLSLLPTALRRAITFGLLGVPIVAVLYSALFAGRGFSLPVAIAVFAAIAVVTYLATTYRQPVRRRVDALPSGQRRTLNLVTLALAGIIVLLLPLLGSYPSEVLTLVGLFVLMGLGLNIVVGYAGLLDLGYVAFFAIGAYTMAIFTSPEIKWFPINTGFWVALPFAILTATMAGVILGIPVLNMRGDYLAIVTLGFGEIIRLVALSDWLKPYIGGSNGITRIPKAAIGPLVFDTPQRLYYLILIGCLVAAFIAWRLKYSRLGRNWMAIREDEDVAQAMGIDLVRNKLLAFATGAALSGTAGAIFAMKLTSIYPHSFNLLVSINVLAVIIVGGLGSIPGVIVGAFALVGLPELLREFAEFRLLVYGIVLILMMLRRPEGLLPDKRRKLELHEVKGTEAE